MVGFVIWWMVALIFVGIGISCLKAKEPVGFWANSNEKIDVKAVKSYNKAMCILWVAYGIILGLLGIPLLDGQNSPWIVVTVFGVMIEVIALICIYIFGIEKKYRK